MSPRTTGETIDRSASDATDEDRPSPITAIGELWYLWIGAAIAAVLAAYAFTHSITGPVDEFLFAAIAVALVLWAAARPLRRAWTYSTGRTS